MTPEHGRSAASSPGRERAGPARERARSGFGAFLCALVLLGALAGGARAQEAPATDVTPQDSLSAGAPSIEEPATADSAAPAPAPARAATVAPPRGEPDLEVPPAAEDDASAAPAQASTPAPSEPLVAPENLNSLDAWLDYKTRGHLLALPEESHLFYRRALMLHASGGDAEAIRLARGAVRLDPGFVAPRVTLGAWLLMRESGEALEQWGDILRLARDNFMIQMVTATNVLYLLLQSLFLSVLATSLVFVVLNQSRLRHGWMERLASFVTPETAGWWSWAILLGPYLAGLGPALPTLAFLGLLWPMARLRERSLFVLLALTLVGVPLMGAALDRLSSPLHDDRAPFYGVPQLQTEPYSAGLRAEYESRAAAYPDNPFLRFAAGWLAQRGGDLISAEASYRRTLEMWPDDDRVLNNLANTLAGQGRSDEAVSAYHRAIAVNPRNPAAHFNISQIYTMRYDFHTANEELAKASALDFELVKNLQAERAETKWAGLADQWISPLHFWRALKQAPSSTAPVGALPPLWRTRIECSGWRYSLVALLVAIASLGLGWWFHRVIPVRGCGNCGRAVCRRCAERRREMALCSECAAIWSRAESSEFARVLLFQHRRRREERSAMAFRIAGLFLPGFGYLPHRKLLRPVILMGATAALVSISLGIGAPFAFEPRFGVPGHDVPLIALGLVWLLFYALTIPAYLAFDELMRERAKTPAAPPQRRRPAIAPTNPTHQAAA
jgi:hypothetical protein